MIPLIITGIIIIFIILLLFLPIGIGAKYENGVFYIVKIAFVSFCIPIRKKVDLKTKKKDSEENAANAESNDNTLEKSIVGIDFILTLFGNFRKFVRKRFSLTSFELNVTFGVGDAAHTAILSGHLWSLAYNMLSLVDKLFYVDAPKVMIDPVFNDTTLSVRAQGIIKTRIAHIIATAVVFAYKFFKYKRNKTRRTTK